MNLNSPQTHQKLALLPDQPVSLSPTLIQIPDGLLCSSHTLCSSLLQVSQSSPPQQAAALSPQISCAECCHQLFCLTHSSVWAPSLKAKTSEDGALHPQQELFQHVWCSNHGISPGSTADTEKSPEDLLKHCTTHFNLLANSNSQKKQRNDNRYFQCYNFKTDVEVFSPPTCEALPNKTVHEYSSNVRQPNY